MSYRISFACNNRIYYYFGRTEEGLVGAKYCSGLPLHVQREEDYGKLYVFEREKKWPWGLVPVSRFVPSGRFLPLCTPSVRWGGGCSRWWGSGYVVLKGDLGDVYVYMRGVVTENFEIVEMDIPELFDKTKRCVFERGAGSLEGEFSVVRRRFGYLKVGGWLAWHRVLGVLDDGRWVVVGDDGLYEAVFTPTVKNPLEEFGEVGYVRVVKPYEGDPDLVQSPCGAPRLVACGEEGVEVGRAVLRRVRRVLDGAEVRGELFVGEFRCVESFIFPELVEAGVPARVIHDWPLADPCPHVLRAADGEPFGLFTPATQLPFYD